MYFAVISVFPEMFATIREFGITGRAVTREQVTIECINPRDFTTDNYRRIDERPYGGGSWYGDDGRAIVKSHRGCAPEG